MVQRRIFRSARSKEANQIAVVTGSEPNNWGQSDMKLAHMSRKMEGISERINKLCNPQ
jgi:hypothetical protein